MNPSISIEDINRMTGQETLHPLVTVVGGDDDVPAPCPAVWGEQAASASPSVCDFYALVCHPSCRRLCLYRPGDAFALPRDGGCQGVLFHADLLCGTSLERKIGRFAACCRDKTLTGTEMCIIDHALCEISRELHHSIDRFSAPIIVSHISLLLDYCSRFCNR